jgi:hypothetical protein
MLIDDYSALLLSKDKHRALLKEVESIRIVQQCRRRNRRKLYSGLMNRLGTAFIAIGRKLKEM